VVGHGPVAPCGVAEEAAGDAVVDVAAGHALQRGAHHFVHAPGAEQAAGVRRHVRGCAGAAHLRVGQGELEHVRLRELGVRAQAAVHGVEGAHHFQRDLGWDVAGHVRVAFEIGRRPVAAERRGAQVRARRVGVGGARVLGGLQGQQRHAVGGEEVGDSR
jgi:hypothetical protein